MSNMKNQKLSDELIKIAVERTDVPTDVRMELLFLGDEISEKPLFINQYE